MPEAQQVGAIQEWKRSWQVVFAAALATGLASVSVYTVGVFMEPLEKEFGWSRASISFGITLSSFISVVIAPFAGMLVDRLGPRRIGVAGVVAYCACLASFSLTGPALWNWWGLWLIYSLSAALMKPTVWTAGVSSWFNAGRGLALSVMLCGTALGSSLTPVIGNWLIEHYGWRYAYVGLSLFWLVFVFPPVFFFFTSVKDSQRISTDPAVKVIEQPGVGIREGLLSWTFFKLALAAFTASLVIVSFTSNLVPILSSKDITRAEAAGIAGLVGLATVTGRLTGGYLLDRMNGNLVAAVSVALPAIPAALLLAFPGDVTIAAAAVLVLGLSLGVELDAVAYLSTRHFGMRNFGVLFGTIGGLLALATGLGPFLVNVIYDTTGAYDTALYAYFPLCALMTGLFLSLGRYPVFAVPQPEQHGA